MSPTPAGPEPTCDDVEPMLPLIAEGLITATHDPQIFAHLARCECCQEGLARHDLISLAFGDRTTSGVEAGSRPWLWLASAASVMTAISLGALALQPGQEALPPGPVHALPAAATPSARDRAPVHADIEVERHGDKISIRHGETVEVIALPSALPTQTVSRHIVY